jgi:hypothetical protein
MNSDNALSARYCPLSQLFIERLIGSCRREFTDHILFWSESDLLAKLSVFQKYETACKPVFESALLLKMLAHGV